ncbi:MAG: MarR family transcriptional regulator [Clostridiales bacterium]|jgi:DNA-binding MarR family transcriptional regulator|nr:MarR family transcriptional regulator [Clostridiales bacterium]
MDESKGIKLLRSCFGMRRQMRKVLSQGRLKPGEYLVLRRLYAARQGGALPPHMGRAARISEFLDVPPPIITRILNSLEDRGFIERKIDKTNRRSPMIEPTETGAEVLAESEKILARISDALAEELQGEDLDGLTKLIDKIADFFDRLPDENAE